MTVSKKLSEILAGMKQDILKPEDIHEGMNLREDLFFSSFEFLELVAELEKGFSISFDSSDFSSANFETTDALVALVSRKLEAVNASVAVS